MVLVPTVVPDCDRTMNASALLIDPSVFTSERKLASSIIPPERLRVCRASPEFTAPSPFVSPLQDADTNRHLACVNTVTDPVKGRNESLPILNTTQGDSDLFAISAAACAGDRSRSACDRSRVKSNRARKHHNNLVRT